MINANKFLVKRKINARKNYFNITILQKVFDNRYLVVILFLCQSNWEEYNFEILCNGEVNKICKWIQVSEGK